MPRYEYQALNAAGQPVAGAIEADTVSQAVIQLESLGLTIQSIGQSGTSPFQDQPAAPARPADAHALLHQHIPRAMERGALLTPALRALAEELTAGSERRKLQSFITILERRNSEHAVATFHTLPAYWIPLLSAAPLTDQSQALQKFVSKWRQTQKLSQSTWVVLTYSLIVLAAATAVMVALSVLVVPTFRNIFAEFGLRTPFITRTVITFSEWILNGRLVLAAALVLGLIALLIVAARRLPPSIARWFGDRYGTPLGRTAAMARFTNYVADLLEAQVPARSAVQLAGIAANSPRVGRAALGLARTLDTNEGIDECPWRVIPSTVQYALIQNLDDRPRVRLLRELSSAYADRAQSRNSWTRGVIEPLAIIFIGLMVGWVVIALYLPLVTLLQALS